MVLTITKLCHAGTRAAIPTPLQRPATETFDNPIVQVTVVTHDIEDMVDAGIDRADVRLCYDLRMFRFVVRCCDTSGVGEFSS